MATKIICDRCGREITGSTRYIVGCTKSQPTEGKVTPSSWLWTRELCMACALVVEQTTQSKGGMKNGT